MPVRKGPNCVGEEMRRFKAGQMHSGEDGPVVKDKKHALAIALSACGQSKYAETLQSLGYSSETAKEITAMFSEVDWQRQFETGKAGPEKKLNYETGQKYSKGFLSRMAKTGVKGDGGKLKVNDDASMISGTSLPKGPANPMGGSSKDVTGMRQLG
jgi:hypothetical protein